MKELSDYTTEELKQELRRRMVLKMQKVIKKNRKIDWHIWEGVVVAKFQKENLPPRYRIDSQELKDNREFKYLNRSQLFSLNTDFFRSKKSYPNIGDRVKLRYRITKENTYFDSMIIIGEKGQNLFCVIDTNTGKMIHYGSYKGCSQMLRRRKEPNLKIEPYNENND